VTPRVSAWAIITVLATGIGSSSGHVTPPAATASSMVNQSVRFPGGSDEPRPNVRVRWIRLGSNREHSVIDERGWTTNGLTPETGWLMMAGAFPRTDVRGASVLDAGCWKVEATYKGSTLTYVIELPGWRSEPAGAAPIKRVRSGSIPNRAQYALMTGSAHTPAWS
jgi:hypothetical protein